MDYRTRVREELRHRCRQLCTKRAFFPLPDPGEAQLPGDTAVWWCGRTAEALGPDGRTAGPDECSQTSRRCHEGPETVS